LPLFFAEPFLYYLLVLSLDFYDRQPYIVYKGCTYIVTTAFLSCSYRCYSFVFYLL